MVSQPMRFFMNQSRERSWSEMGVFEFNLIIAGLEQLDFEMHAAD